MKASERLLKWSSLFALSAKQELRSLIPAPLADKTDSVVLDGLAPNTRTSYAAGILRFTQFCDEWNIPEAHRMPASSTLLAAFASSYVGHYRGKTINQWLSGLCSWHIINHAPWFGDDERLHLIRKAADKQGTQFKRPMRPPVTLDHLRCVLSSLDLNDPFHAAVWATATTSFFGCRRLGETTVPSADSFNPLFHCSRSVDIIFNSSPSSSTSVSFHIPWSKTTRAEGFSVVLTARNDELCPVFAILNHLRVNANPPPSFSLFGFKTPSGSWTHMVKRDFLTFISSFWADHSSSHISGHCFRIGGAVALLLSGVPPEVVAATGGWTSLAFLLYWRRVEQIIPLSTSLAYSRSQLDSVSTAMHKFSCSVDSSP